MALEGTPRTALPGVLKSLSAVSFAAKRPAVARAARIAPESATGKAPTTGAALIGHRRTVERRAY